MEKEANGGRESDSYLRRSVRSFVRVPRNWLPVIIIVAGLMMALVPFEWLPFDATRVNLSERLQAPTFSMGRNSHFLGTDVLGRDVFSRVVFAARWTFLVSLTAVVISTSLGTLAGLLAGFHGGKIDALLSRLMDVQIAFPVVLLAISVLAVAGPSLINMILVLGLVDWAQYARVIRGSTLRIRQNDYVESARAVGASDRRIIFHHILPNVTSTILVLTTFSAARLMLTESALSFLGLGVTPPATTWGDMIGGGRDYIYQAWWITALPGVMITATVLAMNLLGDSLRDNFDPRFVSH